MNLSALELLRGPHQGARGPPSIRSRASWGWLLREPRGSEFPSQVATWSQKQRSCRPESPVPGLSTKQLWIKVHLMELSSDLNYHPGPEGLVGCPLPVAPSPHLTAMHPNPRHSGTHAHWVGVEALTQQGMPGAS